MSHSPSQDYLDKHHLTSVFDELLKEVLEKKPERPLEFLVTQLSKFQLYGFSPIKRHIVFVLGPPGSGKGTQCAKLVEDFGFVHLSAGDLLRDEIKGGTEEGKMIDGIIREGKIVPGHITIRLLKKKIESFDSKTRFLIDGFPREMGQAIDFEREIAKAQYVLFFECPLEIVERRLIERGKTSGRSDDSPDVIIKRFNTYVCQTKPVIDYFGSQNRVKKLDTSRDIDSVYLEVKKTLGL